MTRLLQLALGLAALPCGAAVLAEDFSANPLSRGWRILEDASLFHWNSTNQNVAVTWDSSRTNSFFMLPFGNVLSKVDDFSFSFDLRLSDIRVGSTPGKTNEFEIAIGLLNQRDAATTNFYRGAGTSAAYGVRNVVEFDYFPDAGHGDTWATTVISSNNVFAFAHNFLTLSTGDLFRITLSHTAGDGTFRTTATKNGVPFGPLEDVPLVSTPGFSDFRVDAFAIINYSDAIQHGSPAYHGSVLAHGTVDNVSITLPPPPIGPLRLSRQDTLWRVEFQTRTNWLYTLERATAGLSGWSNASAATPGNGGLLTLSDTNNPGTATFYRVRGAGP